MIKITQFRNKCIGCGYCEEIAPEYWKMNAVDGKVDLIGASGKNEMFSLDTFDEDLELILRTIEVCPTKVIRVQNL